MHPKDILEAIGVLHRAQSETVKNPGGDQMVIKGVDIGPSSKYYGVRTIVITTSRRTCIILRAEIV